MARYHKAEPSFALATYMNLGTGWPLTMTDSQNMPTGRTHNPRAP
jgi:hypothetical protein